MALSKADFNNINVTPAASKKLKWNASANGFETGDVGGSMVLLSTQTASGSANLSFTSGINSTYKEYVFKFINMHPATDQKNFQVNFRDGGTNYDAIKTSTYFASRHKEDGTDATVGYDTDFHLAQSTNFQTLVGYLSADNDHACSGYIHLFNPSSTTFVKHYLSVTSNTNINDYNKVTRSAGYCNTTVAIDGVQFKMSSGNIDAGTITLYGIN